MGSKSGGTSKDSPESLPKWEVFTHLNESILLTDTRELALKLDLLKHFLMAARVPYADALQHFGITFRDEDAGLVRLANLCWISEVGKVENARCVRKKQRYEFHYPPVSTH